MAITTMELMQLVRNAETGDVDFLREGVRVQIGAAHGVIRTVARHSATATATGRGTPVLARLILAKVPRSAQPMVASLVRTIFAQERAEDAWRQLGDVVAKLEEAKLDAAAQLLADAAPTCSPTPRSPRTSGRRSGATIPRNG